jgi:hypothetical protein
VSESGQNRFGEHGPLGVKASFGNKMILLIVIFEKVKARSMKNVMRLTLN